MSFTWLDVVLVSIMLISGFLAVMRGFFREIMSLVAWGGAAGAAALVLSVPELRQQAADVLKPYLDNNDTLIIIAIAGIVFLVMLIVLSIITVKLSDSLLESGAGPIDRSLGFLYGLTRGLALMVIMFTLFVWYIPREKVPNELRDAAMLPLVENSSFFLVDTMLTIGWMQPALAEDLNGKIRISGGSRSNSEATRGTSGEGNTGYQSNQRNTLDQIIESTQGQQ
ncbi:CvpA family protein [Anderseniella sp. Alg231-50]|uniref:CvpA family protein n=1 Tax=Anderseniella sp. Alg231-50 TaxID=1922226 RepID=UPI000D5543E8